MESPFRLFGLQKLENIPDKYFKAGCVYYCETIHISYKCVLYFYRTRISKEDEVFMFVEIFAFENRKKKAESQNSLYCLHVGETGLHVLYRLQRGVAYA